MMRRPMCCVVCTGSDNTLFAGYPEREYLVMKVDVRLRFEEGGYGHNLNGALLIYTTSQF